MAKIENLKENSKKVNPVFDDLSNPGTFKNEFEKFKNEIKNNSNKNPFPVEVFPEQIQEIILNLNDVLNFPIDFTGASILFASSVAIGNTHRIEIKKGYTQNASLYLALVGKPGVIKSHPLAWAINPLSKQDAINYNQYKKELQEYETIQNLSKKEKEAQGVNEILKPYWKQSLLQDITQEALISVHDYNKRGLGVYSDELKGWVADFNRYNSGSAEQFWLSAFNGNTTQVNRKTGNNYNIPNTFISVAGTIQPEVLEKLSENRTENGFIDRIIFVAPENLKKEGLNKKELNLNIIENWNNIINELLKFPLPINGNNIPEPILLRFATDAENLFFNWQNDLANQSNKPENEEFAGIYAKIEMYAARFALILQLLRCSCNIDNKETIGIEATKGALKLAEYFKTTATKIHTNVLNASALDKLTIDKQTLYNNLPGTFPKNEGLVIATKLNISERTFGRFLSNKELFKRVKQGIYEKMM